MAPQHVFNMSQCLSGCNVKISSEMAPLVVIIL